MKLQITTLRLGINNRVFMQGTRLQKSHCYRTVNMHDQFYSTTSITILSRNFEDTTTHANVQTDCYIFGLVKRRYKKPTLIYTSRAL
jgi:hypothetical protein